MSIQHFKGAIPETRWGASAVRAAVGTVAEHLLYNNVKTATKYLGERYVVRATAMRKLDKRTKKFYFMVTVGIPNYLSQKFIRDCQKAKQSIPLNRAQLKSFPIKRKRKKK